jgi:hypothetical protein
MSRGTVPPANSAGGATKPTTTTLRISVPHATATSSLRRTPAFIASTTQSITIDVHPHLSGTSVSGFPITANLTASSSGCTSTLAATVCDIGLNLAAGNYDATLTTFDGAGGTGNVLSAAQSMPLLVVEGAANTVPLVLGGLAASVVIGSVSGQLASAHGVVYTLTASLGGTLFAYGADADGDLIIGAGAPAISASSDAPTQVTATSPSASSPNSVSVTSQGAKTIAHITITATPVAGTGSGPVSKTVTVQTPDLPLLYVANYGGHIFDATATDVTPPGTAYANIQAGVGLAYDTANGFLYASSQTGAQSVLAFDRAGNAQTLSSGATNLSTIGSIAYAPSNGKLYIGNNAVALDQLGNQTALAQQIQFSYGLAYDPQHNVIVSGAQTYNLDGTTHGTLPFSGQVTTIAYNPVNGWIYVSTVYPTATMAYDTNGNLQTLSGTFINNSTEQIGGMACDPLTGNVYLATNYSNTYGFDLNGNPLPPPWHTISGVGAGSGAAGVAAVPPQ